MLRGALLLAVVILCATNVRGEYKPKDDRFDEKGCEKPERELKGYVGVGYDELTGQYKSSPYEVSFEKNVTTDGGCFLVPDDVTARNISDYYAKSNETSRYSLFETSAAISYGLSVQSHDINGLGSVRLSFSTAHETAMEFARQEDTITFIFQANLIAFELRLEASRKIEPVLKSRLESMVLSYTEGFKQTARHKAETIIRDYGTTIVNHARAGLMTSFFASSKFSSQKEAEVMKEVVRAAAEAEFNAGEPSVGGSAEGGREQRIKTHVDKTAVYPVGQRLLPSSQKSVVSYTDYAKVPQSFESVAMVVDRAGLNVEQTKIAKELLDEAIKTYLKGNTYRGCMDPWAANYNASVNVDDGSCIPYTAFGGFYFRSDADIQTGKLDGGLNPVLDVNGCGNYSRNGVKMVNDRHIVFCFSRDHKLTSNQKKAYFGGMYHPKDNFNLLTNASGCPQGHQNHSLGPAVYGLFICFDVTRTAKDAYEVSQFVDYCASDGILTCDLKNFQAVKFHKYNYKKENCYVGACVYKGSIELNLDLRPVPAIRPLPFTAMGDETNGNFLTENMALIIVLIVVIAVLVLATAAFFVLRARRLSRAQGVAKPSKNSATGSTTSLSKMKKDTTTSQATVGDNRKTARSGANRSAPNTPAAKTAGTTTGATPK